MQIAPVPFYLDWTFWAVVVAVAALVLSQLPPIHLLLRPKRLEVEVHSRIQVTHQIGNPNVALVLRISNTGGRELRIKHIELNITRDGKPVVTLPAQGYFETPSSQTSVLFVPFTIKPGDHWTHSVNFVTLFERQTEKIVRERASVLQADIHEKLERRPDGDKRAVVAEAENVAPFLDLFKALFVWHPGEYVAALSVVAEPGSSSYSRKYRFTLYESDAAELTKHTKDYKYGAGIHFTDDRHVGLQVALTEHVG